MFFALKNIVDHIFNHQVVQPALQLSVKAKLAPNQSALIDDLSYKVLALGEGYRIQLKIGYYRFYTNVEAQASR